VTLFPLYVWRPGRSGARRCSWAGSRWESNASGIRCGGYLRIHRAGSRCAPPSTKPLPARSVGSARYEGQWRPVGWGSGTAITWGEDHARIAAPWADSSLCGLARRPVATWRPTGCDCAVATCRRLVLRMTLDIMRPCADARDSGMVSPGATVTAASHRARRPAPSRPRAVSCPGPAARRSSRRGSRGRPPHGGQRRDSRPRRRIPPPSVC
jgi:hypothetical protein